MVKWDAGASKAAFPRWSVGTMKTFFFLFLTLIIVVGCKQPPSKNYLIDLLARDAQFSINNRVYKLPLVAINDISGFSSTIVPCYSNDRPFRACSIFLKEIVEDSPVFKQPIPVNAIQIHFESYNSYQDAATDEYVDISEICERLSQKWAQKICKDNSADKFFGLRLQRFWIIEEDKFEIISEKIGSVTKSLFARIKKANIEDNTPFIQCEIGKEKSPFGLCDVVVRLDNNLLAVWVVVSDENDKSFLEKQVRVIKAFIEHAVGEKENLSAFYKALQ